MFTRMMRDARERRAERGREAAEARERRRTRLLPPDLASQIVEAADREQGEILARLESIESELAWLRGELREAREESRATLTPVWVTPPTTRRNWRGEIFHKGGRRGGVVNAATLKANERVHELTQAMRALSQQRTSLLTDLREVDRVRADAERGVVPALLHIVGKWRNAVDIDAGGMAKVGSSYFVEHAVPSDAAGNPLPAEALGPDGQPAKLQLTALPETSVVPIAAK